MAEKKIQYKLKGHEKFPLREGWINKGLNLLESEEYRKIFLEKHNTDQFGVGTNMVKAIRYWMKAFALIDEKPGEGAKLSKLGTIIKQYDEYLEDKFTLWILHSHIAKNETLATSWYLFFNRCIITEVPKEDIVKQMSRELYKYIEGDSFVERSLIDDIDVLLSMYSKQRGEVDPEDKNASPVAELGLIKKYGNAYSRVQPDLRTIDEMVILFELCDMFERELKVRSNSEEEVGLSIDTISEGDKSIGAIYGLSRVSINRYLDNLESKNYITINRTAGLNMVYRNKENFVIDKYKVLEDYYKTHK